MKPKAAFQSDMPTASTKTAPIPQNDGSSNDGKYWCVYTDLFSLCRRLRNIL
jgi:hypothetical protein